DGHRKGDRDLGEKRLTSFGKIGRVFWSPGLVHDCLLAIETAGARQGSGRFIMAGFGAAMMVSGLSEGCGAGEIAARFLLDPLRTTLRVAASMLLRVDAVLVAADADDLGDGAVGREEFEGALR